jgi:hypothetical protein
VLYVATHALWDNVFYAKIKVKRTLKLKQHDYLYVGLIVVLLLFVTFKIKTNEKKTFYLLSSW